VTLPENRLLSPVDAAWLNMDHARNPMVITGLLRVEGLDAPALRQFLLDAWLRRPRFREVPLSRSGAWWWHPVESIDLDQHLQCFAQPLPDDDALRVQVAACQMETLSPDRPLWKFWHFPMADGAHAVVLRLHHCYADGVSLIRLFESLTTDSPEAVSLPVDEPPDSATGPWLDVVWQWLQGQLGQLSATATPEALLDKASLHGMRLVKEVGDFLLQPADTPSFLKNPLSGHKQCCWSAPVPLDRVKALADERGCTLNDVLLACVATALQQQLIRFDEPLEERRLQAAIPVDLRRLLPAELRPAASSLGNLFGTVFVPLPVDADSVLERVYRIKHETRRLKHSWQPGLSWGLLGAAGYLPRHIQQSLVELFSGRASAIVSNVPGSRCTRYLAGHAVREHLFWVPQTGDIGLGISIMSYAGQVQFGVQADSAVLASPQQLLDDCLGALADFEH